MTPKRRIALALAILLLAGGLAQTLACDCGRKPIAKNILLITVDTLRTDHLGAYGCERPTSPRIDRFADRCTVFDRAYSHSPWTMPSVASILTALAPRDHGIVRFGQPLLPELLTLPEHLQAHGYDTAGIVSHLIFDARYHFDQGFAAYDTSVLAKGDPHLISTSVELSDRVVDALSAPRDRPLFLWVHYFDPHFEYLPHDEFAFGPRDVDRYDSEIAFTDRQLGRVFDALTEQDRWRDTVVVLIADHGEEFGDHGGRYHSETLYDEVIHIPLMIYVPGFSPARVDRVVAESDLAPTLCRLVGLPIPPEFPAPPIPFARDRFEPDSDRTIYAETLEEAADKRGVVQWPWKWIVDRNTDRQSLFNLRDDPHEARNLADEQPDRAARMKESVDAYYAPGRRLIPDRDMDDEVTRKLRELGYLAE